MSYLYSFLAHQMGKCPFFDDAKIKALKFAEDSVETSLKHYARRNQTNATKIKGDIYVGKVGEQLVHDYLKKYDPTITEPDYKVYKPREKTWAPDMHTDTYNVHVKTQSIESSNKYGISWILQYDDAGKHRDKHLVNPQDNDLQVFTLVDVIKKHFHICAVIPIKFMVEHLLDLPKLDYLQKTKRAVYYKRIQEYEDKIPKFYTYFGVEK